MIRLVICCWLALAASPLQAETWQRTLPGGFEAQATISKTNATLTDHIDITLVLKAPEGYQADAKALANNLIEDGEIANSDFKLLSQQIDESGNKTTITYTVTPLSPGHHFLSFRDITFRYKDRTKDPVTLLSGLLAVDVATPDDSIPLPVAGVLPLENRPLLDLDAQNQQELAREAELAPEHNRNIFLNRTFPWHYLLLYPMTLIMIYGAYRLTYRVAKNLWKPRPPPSPTEVATTSLQALESGSKMAEGNFDSFYVELTQTLRQYIEGFYHVAVTDMTTEEFIHRMTQEAPFDDATRQQLTQLLAYADRVKFAKEPASADNCATALAYARQFIRAGQSSESHRCTCSPGVQIQR